MKKKYLYFLLRFIIMLVIVAVTRMTQDDFTFNTTFVIIVLIAALIGVSIGSLVEHLANKAIMRSGKK